ncbi:MAG: hypothetical protein CUN54_09020 [Phototrophicales bacterium]|nr:MAG: hypothetical protein CUN54_09020 [Phototrophicales bacterium]
MSKLSFERPIEYLALIVAILTLLVAILQLGFDIFSLSASQATAAVESTPVAQADTATPQSAESAMPTPSATPTTTPQPTTPIELTIFRDNDSVTLFIPTAATVSLTDIALQVTTTQGVTITNALTGFPSLLPLDNLTTPICLRLERDGAGGVAPLECQRLSSEQVRIQPLAAPNIFWRDDVGGSGRVIIILQNGASVGTCPAGQATCDLMLDARQIVPTASPTTMSTIEATEIPIASLTATLAMREFPCEGEIVFNSSALLNAVRAGPSSQASPRQPIQQGISIVILTKTGFNTNMWYQIASLDGNELGWIPSHLVIPLSLCP